MHLVKESPIIQELLAQEQVSWLKQGRKEGVEEGRKKGKLEAK